MVDCVLYRGRGLLASCVPPLGSPLLFPGVSPLHALRCPPRLAQGRVPFSFPTQASPWALYSKKGIQLPGLCRVHFHSVLHFTSHLSLYLPQFPVVLTEDPLHPEFRRDCEVGGGDAVFLSK